jgi:cobalt/nickel transport system ATP-binding protein
LTTAALSCRHLTVRYEPSAPAVLSDVTFQVAPGERVALIGLNGSGKTSMLMATVGLLPHSGEIEVCGIAVAPKSLADIRDRVGFLFNVPEDQLLFPSVLDDVAFALLRRRVPMGEASAKAMVVLESLGIGHLAKQSLHHLSHGQQQRVALAGALVAAPPLLLLDEPSSALDPPGRRRLAELLRGQPAAMLVATHDLEFARQLCTRFLLLERGGLASDGTDSRPIVQRWERSELRDALGGKLLSS